MVWDAMNAMVGGRGDATSLDPNYLDTTTATLSPWHSALHAFRAAASAAVGAGADAPPTASGGYAPLVHIDIHGKMDRANNMDIDVGMGPMEEDWGEGATELIKGALGPALEGALGGRSLVSRKSKKRMPITIELDPLLSGYWGHYNESPLTISHQSVLLGIPALQLEIPYSIRELLMADAKAFDAFAAALFEAIDAALGADLGTPESLPFRALEVEPHLPPASSAEAHGEQGEGGAPPPPLCELEVTCHVDEAWLGGVLKTLARMDTESVHGKQI